MADTKFYFDFNFPLKLVGFILGVIFGRQDPANPSQSIDTTTREWFSQPRAFSDGGTEVITTSFKLPLSVSEVTMEILRMPCVAEVWYQDRSNNWRQVLDMQRIPLSVNVSRSDAKSYFKYVTKVYPIVAKQLQFRITRTNDPTLEGTPYPVGLRNCLIRRNVYDRSQGNQYFEEEQDVLGNVITKYIKDWDAPKAIDDNPNTFWKSAPMPDPAAVACLFLDVRADDGTPKTIDKVYIDPVYSNQQVNLYYSSDDIVGVRKLSPITINPDEDENTDWRIGRGRADVSTGLSESYYRWSFGVGPQIAQDAWIGVEWTPDFAPGDGPANNPVLYRSIVSTSPGPFKPLVYYDVGAGEFVLEFDDGTDTRSYTAPMTTAFVPGVALRVVAGWRYDPDTVYLSVVTQAGVEIAHLEDTPTTLPHQVSFDGQMEMYRFRGLITALVIKLEDYRASSAQFALSPIYYVDPDPVIPDSQGNIPSTTLDHAVYAYAATAQENGTGGADDSHFEDKEWTPIWRDYIVVKGMMFFPQALSMKYLKLEFTNLTEEAYPIYESGIDVRYKVFPVSVMQQSSAGPRLYTGEGGFLGLGTFISQNGVRSVNWLNPGSILGAIGSVFGTQIDPVSITNGASFITDTLPNNGTQLVQDSTRIEAGSSYVYVRDTLQPYILAQDAYVTTIKAEGLQAISPFVDVPWQDIAAANPGAITKVKSTGTLPVRGSDWWIYPGQQLKVPAAVMQKLTATSTVTERKLTLESRVRFNTTSIHRYDVKTLTRDVAMAYFAGVREVQPYTSTFIAGEDKAYFDFPHYDTDQFTTNHIRQNDSGSTTTLRQLYPIENRLFERDLANWIASDPAWSWDGTTGRFLRGSARLVANGLDHSLLSARQSVVEGDQVDVGVAIKWADLDAGLVFPGDVLLPSPDTFSIDPDFVSDSADVGIRWGVRYYSNDTFLSDGIIGEVTRADWAADPTMDWQDFTGTITVPAEANWFRMILEVTNEVTTGTVWFENAAAADHDTTTATVFKSLETMSTFARVGVDFQDSGLWRGDSMWADINPDSQSIDDTKLAYYTRTIPETIPGGFWGDTTKSWGADDAEWGSPFGVVNITVDGDRRYQGKRVLHFRRAAGAGEAGIKVKQWTHFVPLGLFRIGASFYKPLANDNQATVRLRRMSDGVIVYEETVAAPSGRWYEFQTKFVEIPAGVNQEYEVMLTLDGDAEDELYLSDLYTEIAQIRYFIRLGDVGAFLHEVTDLRYTLGRANVTVTNPVNQMSVQAAILSPESWAYGCRITPTYLK